MLQFDLQFYEELTVARVKAVKFISGAFFWPTGQLVMYHNVFVVEHMYLKYDHKAKTNNQFQYSSLVTYLMLIRSC